MTRRRCAAKIERRHGPPGECHRDRPNQEERRTAPRCVTDARGARRPGEVDAPGSLHYLLEAEGFLVVARASDEVELARVLEHGLDPDVVVLDTDINVESVLVAREKAPAAHVIVVWPDGVQNLPNTERIAPWLVYEQLGPAIRRAVHERPQRRATSGPVTEELLSVSDEPVAPAVGASPGRAASRLSVASLVLIAVLLLTMGAAVALDTWHVRLPWVAPRTDVATHQAASPNAAPTAATPIADRPPHDAGSTTVGSCRPAGDGVRRARTRMPLARPPPTRGRARPTPATPGTNLITPTSPITPTSLITPTSPITPASPITRANPTTLPRNHRAAAAHRRTTRAAPTLALPQTTPRRPARPNTNPADTGPRRAPRSGRTGCRARPYANYLVQTRIRDQRQRERFESWEGEHAYEIGSDVMCGCARTDVRCDRGIGIGGAASDHENRYKLTRLISDKPGVGQQQDTNLVNAWGLVSGPTTPWWVANNHSNTSTLYDGNGNPIPLVVTVGGAPTGTVFNGGSGFLVTHNGAEGPSVFLFATESGVIRGWNPNVPMPAPSTKAFRMVDMRSDGAIFKGLAIAPTVGGDRLYATDFHNGKVDVFNERFHLVNMPGAFEDPNIPAGYAPFGIQNVGNKIIVTYAKQDADAEDDVAGAGFGFVDMYGRSGKLLQRIASPGAARRAVGHRVGSRQLRRVQRRPVDRELRRRHDQRLQARVERFVRLRGQPAAPKRQRDGDPGVVGARVRQRQRCRSHEQPVLHRGSERREPRPVRLDRGRVLSASAQE